MLSKKKSRISFLSLLPFPNHLMYCPKNPGREKWKYNWFPKRTQAGFAIVLTVISKTCSLRLVLFQQKHLCPWSLTSVTQLLALASGGHHVQALKTRFLDQALGSICTATWGHLGVEKSHEYLLQKDCLHLSRPKGNQKHLLISR